MSALAPDLFQRRFQDFMEIGRARLPSLAPEWTDYNAHDPGITLMELLAWVAEAQLYSLSRRRRDERAAYAALLGITVGGTRGAQGLIWSDQLDPNAPVTTYQKSVVVPSDAVINVVGTPNPTFRPAGQLLWVPGRIRTLEGRAARGRTIDFTTINQRGGVAFLPFGERAGPRTVLAIDYVCSDDAGLFGTDRQATKNALWPIGILAAPPLVNASPASSPSAQTLPSPIAATLVDGDHRYPLRVASDTSQGLLTTGTLLLDLDSVSSSPKEFTIELRSPRGFPRPPRLLRVEPSVLPILQGRDVVEQHQAAAIPNWSFTLDVPGLRFEASAEPVTIAVANPEGGSTTTWQRVDRLSDHGPLETVYELDVNAGQVTFGNGLNGRIVPNAQVLVSYSVSDAELGNVARNRKWQASGFQGVFGVNVDTVSGGAAPSTWIDQRRDARRLSVDDHSLVSSADIVDAAMKLPLLEVARAWISTPDDNAPRTGVVTLVAMRARSGTTEPKAAPETARWLDAVRSRLRSRVPLGTRLVVVAPQFVNFSVVATIECARGRDPIVITAAIQNALRAKLTLVAAPGGPPAREPGVEVTKRDITIWIRATEGVSRVTALRLLDAAGKDTNEILVSRDRLPKWLSDASTISVTRPATGGER
jgi:predicted phage baseplate assembly protein